MKRFSFSGNLDTPTLTPDTVVEITSNGDLETVDAAPRQTAKLGDVVTEALKGLGATYADPKRQDEFLGHQVTMEEVADAKLGATDDRALIAQPPGSERIETAADNVLAHKGTLTAMVPSLGKQFEWEQVKGDLAHLQLVTKYKERIGVRFKNMTALEAHLRQRIYANLSLAQKQAGPLIVGNRSLELAMAPFTDLFTAAAEQGATTKRAVAKALKKSGKKGKKAAGGASEAKDEGGGQDSKATPPVKDAPPARDPR